MTRHLPEPFAYEMAKLKDISSTSCSRFPVNSKSSIQFTGKNSTEMILTTAMPKTISTAASIVLLK